MNLRGARRGDVVELAGDPVSLWVIVKPPEQRRLKVMLRGRDHSLRTIGSSEVTGLWRRR